MIIDSSSQLDRHTSNEEAKFLVIDVVDGAVDSIFFECPIGGFNVIIGAQLHRLGSWSAVRGQLVPRNDAH